MMVSSPDPSSKVGIDVVGAQGPLLPFLQKHYQVRDRDRLIGIGR